MSWFADLAGRAENLLNNIDEQTGAALRNHNVVKSKTQDSHDYALIQEKPWTQNNRQTARSVKKVSKASETKSSNFPPIRNLSPTRTQSKTPTRESLEYISRPTRKKSPCKRTIPYFNLNHCPDTVVGDVKICDSEEKYSSKQRRYSLPTDSELLSAHNLTYKMQNLEVENAMLKNELNVMNREVSELLERLRRTEDELNKNQSKLESSELQNKRLNLDIEAQNSQLVQLKHKIYELTNNEILDHKEKNETLETEISILKDRNDELEEKLKQLTERLNESNTAQIKSENDLRHAQSVINDLQANLDKSNAECHRLEKDWEAYKLRVKGMLFAKDNEIKALQDGVTVSQDTKTLSEQLEQLKLERDSLSDAVAQVRRESDDIKQYVEQLETRHASAERVVNALREALKEERAANSRAEAQNLELGKELKSLQIETAQTISCLREELRDKDSEISHLRNISSSALITDSNAVNVADYDVTQDSIESDRVHYLTEALVQKQTKIDSLLADNNILRIQLEKLESKYKSELVSRLNQNHVVHLQDSDRRTRSQAAVSPLSGISMRIGLMMRRNPVFRMFIVVYMICLHLWVLTVLFTSTPDGHMTRIVNVKT